MTIDNVSFFTNTAGSGDLLAGAASGDDFWTLSDAEAAGKATSGQTVYYSIRETDAFEYGACPITKTGGLWYLSRTSGTVRVSSNSNLRINCRGNGLTRVLLATGEEDLLRQPDLQANGGTIPQTNRVNTFDFNQVISGIDRELLLKDTGTGGLPRRAGSLRVQAKNSNDVFQTGVAIRAFQEDATAGSETYSFRVEVLNNGLSETPLEIVDGITKVDALEVGGVPITGSTETHQHFATAAGAISLGDAVTLRTDGKVEKCIVAATQAYTEAQYDDNTEAPQCISVPYFGNYETVVFCGYKNGETLRVWHQNLDEPSTYSELWEFSGATFSNTQDVAFGPAPDGTQSGILTAHGKNDQDGTGNIIVGYLRSTESGAGTANVPTYSQLFSPGFPTDLVAIPRSLPAYPGRSPAGAGFSAVYFVESAEDIIRARGFQMQADAFAAGDPDPSSPYVAPDSTGSTVVYNGSLSGAITQIVAEGDHTSLGTTRCFWIEADQLKSAAFHSNTATGLLADDHAPTGTKVGAVTTLVASGADRVSVAYDPTNDLFLIAESGTGKLYLGTPGGTTGTGVPGNLGSVDQVSTLTIDAGTDIGNFTKGTISVAYDKTNDRFVVVFQKIGGQVFRRIGKVVSGSVSWQTTEQEIGFGAIGVRNGGQDADFAINPEFNANCCAHDVYHDTLVFVGIDPDDATNYAKRIEVGAYSFNSNLLDFVGFAASSVSDGQTVEVNVAGVEPSVSGLSPNSTYYLDANDGQTLTTDNATGVKVGRALAANRLLIASTVA